jgi:hypothetical protein
MRKDGARLVKTKVKQKVLQSEQAEVVIKEKVN